MKQQAKEDQMHHRVRQTAFSSMKNYKNWASIDPLKLTVRNSHGYGDSKTYHVIAPKECQHHSIGVHFPEYPTMIPGMVTALKALNAAKLCPQVLAVEEDCFVDEWKEPKGIEEEKKNPNYWKECGELLAKVHMVPTTWWEPLRSQLIKQDPVVEKFPQGSLAWAYLRRQVWQKCLKKLDQNTKIQLAQAVTTEHPIGKRIVTSHGDFHPGNIIDLGKLREEGLLRYQVIDYEFTCVTHAIQDLAFGIACCGQDTKNKKMFLKAYLQGLGELSSQNDILTLQIQAEICQLASWHSGGMLAPWQLQNKKPEEALEIINLVKQVATQIRESKEYQKSILSSRLSSYIENQKSPIYQYQLNKFKKTIQQAQNETNQCNQSIKIDQAIKALLDKATWSQPLDQKLPIKIGHSSELGLSSSFTALCWVKNEKPYNRNWYKGRNAIFMGDVNPQSHKMDWSDFKSKIFHLQLRHQGRYYFGFGWDDASSQRVCLKGRWEHVAFVYKDDGETKEKMIFVNGRKRENRWGTKSKQYQGNEVIWLGTGNSHGIGKWEGDIKSAMIYKEALDQEDILKIAKATCPQSKQK